MMLDFAPGHKTFVLCLIGIIVNVLVSQGVMVVEELSTINTALIFGAIGTTRMAITRE